MEFNKYYFTEEDFETTYLPKSKKEPDVIGQAVISLKGKKSEEATKLIKQLMDIKEKELELKQRKQELECSSKELCDSLFKAQDEVYTRVLETASAILTVNKASERTNVDWKGAVNEMLTVFTPSIAKQMEKILNTYTNFTKIDPKVSVKMKEGVGDFINKGINFVKKLINDIMSWGRSYDKELQNFKDRYEIQ